MDGMIAGFWTKGNSHRMTWSVSILPSMTLVMTSELCLCAAW